MMSVFTDGTILLVYIDRIIEGLFRILKKKTGWWCGSFYGRFYQRNYRENHRRKYSVGDFIDKS